MNNLMPSYSDKITEILTSAAEINSAEVVDIELGFGDDNFARLFIYSPKGVTVDLCARINRDINRMLEEDDDLPDTLPIEVSSPGLDRPLVNEKDFIRNIGKLVLVRYEDEEGKKVKAEGVIKAIKEDFLVINRLGKNFEIKLDKIKKAKQKINI